MKPGRFNIIIGAQAGSESKGKISAYLAAKHRTSVLYMSSSPNAGHTVIDAYDRKFVTYHLPAAAVACNATIVLGPSSIINPKILANEIEQNNINPARIIIDPRAISITEEHLRSESRNNLSDIGSTLQGVGAARIAKLMRGDVNYLRDDPMIRFKFPSIDFSPTTPYLHSRLASGAVVLAEMTQGFDLCLDHGIHPRYCTSKILSPSSVMAEAGIPPQGIGDIYGVLRPYPIRVNNRTGTSGPYTGSTEITWDTVALACGYPDHLPPLEEITTTTKLPRRVFTFSWERFAHFCMVCRPTHLALNFANYIDWSNLGKTSYNSLSQRTQHFVEELRRVAVCPVSLIGTGPGEKEIVDIEGGTAP